MCLMNSPQNQLAASSIGAAGLTGDPGGKFQSAVWLANLAGTNVIFYHSQSNSIVM